MSELEFPDPASLMDDIDRLRAALSEYASHQSWRCDHAPHYYLVTPPADGDCACGLRNTLIGLGFDPEVAGPCANA